MGSPAEIIARPAIVDKPAFSVGAIGDHQASTLRRKIIHGSVIDHPDLFRDLTTTAYRTWSDKLGPQGRVSVLSLVTKRAKDMLLGGDQQPLGVLETVFPIQTAGGELWFMGAALNGPKRVGTSTIEQVSDRIHIGRQSSLRPETHVEQLSPDVTLSSTIPKGGVAKLHDLWEPPFGWPSGELYDLQAELTRQHEPGFSSEARTVFYAGIYASDGLPAAAMAETLFLEGVDGEPMALVEPTEWHARRTGLIRAAVESTIGQALDAYDGRIPVAVSPETNAVNSKAPNVGFDVGLTPPDVRFPNGMRVPGVRMRNVAIGDGKPSEGFEWNGKPVRDFGVLHLSEQARRTRYSLAQRERMAARLVQL